MQTTLLEKSIVNGEYKREDSVFRNWITPDGAQGITGDGGFKAEENRYHLYVSLACPWAHRTLIFRQLKSLEKIISVSVVHPDMPDNDWVFKHDKESAEMYGTTGDTLYAKQSVKQIYPENYTGIITVPILWDKQQKCIVNNESSEIIRMFNTAFNDITNNILDFYPQELKTKIDKINDWIYTDINNGVYKTGFAGSQEVYEKNFTNLFRGLDRLENILSKQRYLVGKTTTEADWRLVTTLFRFDAVYHTHFKCNLKLIKEYKNIYGYMLDLYQYGNIKNTLNMAHIKRHYYASHLSINPKGIVAIGPKQDWSIRTNRENIFDS